MKKWLALSSAMSVIIAVAFSPSAHAQDVEKQDSSAVMLEGVVVTARRVEENLQTTPVAVTAIGAEELVASQVIDMTSLQRLAPGLMVATGSPGPSSFTFVSIRGQGNIVSSPSNDMAVGIYVDGVYIPRASQGVTDLVDMQRVEVLRGPQGTLFGRNTTGGALNYITNKPNGELSARLIGELGNYDQRRATAIVNIPLSGDQIATRFVYSFREHSGYGYNAALNQDFQDLRSHFLRGQIRFKPTNSSWELLLSGDYNRVTDNGQLVVLTAYDRTNSQFIATGAAPRLAAELVTSQNWYTTYGTLFQGQPNFTEPYDRLTAYGFSGTLTGEIGAVTLTSISGYRYSRAHSNSDIDGTSVAILASNSTHQSEQWSQELQLSGKIGDRLDFITGVYYSSEDGAQVGIGQTLGVLQVLGVPRPPNRTQYDAENTSFGAFTQGNYQLSDKVRLTAGLRWTWDKRQVVIQNLRVNGNPATCAVPAPDGGSFPPCRQTRQETFDYPAWTLGVDYQPYTGLMVYAKTSGAARAGGFNTRNGAELVPAFNPEKVKDVEVGAKVDLLDGRLRINAALFHSWASGLQRSVSTVVGGASTNYVVNSGDVRIKGAEFEVTAAPWTGMQVSAALALLDGNYKKGSFKETQLIGGAPVVVDRSGERLPQLPDVQFNLNLSQTVPLPIGELTVRGGYAYVSSQSFFAATVPAGVTAARRQLLETGDRLGRIAGYGLFNGRIGLRFNERAELYVFGANLADKKYISRSFSEVYSEGIGISTAYVGNPRTFGLGVDLKY